MIIVGSTALKLQGYDLRHDKECDIDVLVANNSELELDKQFDTIPLPKEIIDMFPTIGVLYGIPFATVDAIYTLKLSHLAWDIKWRKHKNDCIKLRELGATKLVKLYDALVAHWNIVNTDKDRLSLYKTKTEFFDDHVEYVYDHDYLHEIVALPDKPIYSLCLKNGQEVAIDKEKFFRLPKDKQLRMFQEEVTVIAAERWLIPKRSSGKVHWIKAYNYALHKTITSLTKGWATQFMIDNLEYYIRPNFELFKNLYDKGVLEVSKQLTNEEKETLLLEIMNARFEHDGDVERRVEIDNECYYNVIDDTDFTLNDNEFVCIESSGGEGAGGYANTIFQWKGIYYNFEYAYYSYNGFEFDYGTMTEVKPRQETITVYK